MVSISGCDPLDPGSNPGTAITFFLFTSRSSGVLGRSLFGDTNE